MKHRSKMTQRELNKLTDKSLNAYVIYEDGSASDTMLTAD